MTSTNLYSHENSIAILESGMSLYIDVAIFVYLTKYYITILKEISF